MATLEWAYKGRIRVATFSFNVVPPVVAEADDTPPVRVMAQSAPAPTMVGGRPT